MNNRFLTGNLDILFLFLVQLEVEFMFLSISMNGTLDLLCVKHLLPEVLLTLVLMECPEVNIVNHNTT
jgi:hypothetical protein